MVPADPADIPSRFVLGDEDLNMPPAVQRSGAGRAGARATGEVPGGSHPLAVSKPDAVAETILEAVDAVSAQRAARPSSDRMRSDIGVSHRRLAPPGYVGRSRAGNPFEGATWQVYSTPTWCSKAAA
jgi:hypothetical protein